MAENGWGALTKKNGTPTERPQIPGSASLLPLCLKLDAHQMLFEPVGQVHASIVRTMPSCVDQTLGRILDHADHHAHHHEHRANGADDDGCAERQGTDFKIRETGGERRC